ncbi:BON domain-containing protein [Alkalilimnicola sp. S0819]|uniref:BON domain-containing protein n=1 Tax=Alkalilimnicola sp. S0819 TaxID=2613922 RepID=UPI00186A1BD5|nr:BON domain-containing protein [Alkalilimnicola sp. S0819]
MPPMPRHHPATRRRFARRALAGLLPALLLLPATAHSASDRESADPTQLARVTESLMPPADDLALVRRVKARLLADERLDGKRITVDSLGGRITLYGTVAESAHGERALQLAQSVDGVQDVSSRLQSLAR